MPDTPIIYCYVPGDPKAKGRPRFSRKSGRAYTPEQTMTAEAWVRTCWLEEHGQTLFDNPIELGLTIGMKIPRSWSKKRAAAARAGLELPTKVPDIDNIYKLAEDALNGIAWVDDKQIVCIPYVHKVYTDTPGLVLAVRLLDKEKAPAWVAEALVMLAGFQS